MLPQAEAACIRPLSHMYMPYEAAGACSVLCNCIKGVDFMSIDSGRTSTLCESGMPAVLRTLLGADSALLRPADNDVEALAPVVDLVSRMLRCSAGRRALLDAAPDKGGQLVLVLHAMANHHPHGAAAPNVDPFSAAAHAARAIGLLKDAAESVPPDEPAVLAYQAMLASLGLQHDVPHTAQAEAELLKLASSLGWRASAAPQRHVDSVDACRIDCVSHGPALRILCAGCGTEEPAARPFKKCASCRVTLCCSKKCQKAHWKAAHKRECVPAAPR